MATLSQNNLCYRCGHGVKVSVTMGGQKCTCCGSPTGDLFAMSLAAALQECALPDEFDEILLWRNGHHYDVVYRYIKDTGNPATAKVLNAVHKSVEMRELLDMLFKEEREAGK